MADARKLLDQFLGTGTAAEAVSSRDTGRNPNLDISGMLRGPGGVAAGAVAGGLVGLLLGGKKPRKLAKTALKVGGGALVGGLTLKAWQNWQANQSAVASVHAGAGQATVQTPPSYAFFPATQAEQEDLSRALLRSMIAATKADGHISMQERERLSVRLAALSLDPADQAFIEQELAKPLDIDAVARSAKTPQQAAEIYAAALLAIDPDGPVEKGYLGMLAARLGLDPDLVAHLHASAESLMEIPHPPAQASQQFATA